MMNNIVAVTSRKICVNAHPEYQQMNDWHAYADIIKSEVKCKNVICDGNVINECAILLTQIKKIVKRDDIAFVILREKDLPEEVYRSLYSLAYDICYNAGVRIVAHSFIDVVKPGDSIHLSMPALRERRWTLTGIRAGASIHSIEEALEAQKLGAQYIIAGNIYETDCKAGLPGRGIKFLRNVCESVDIPVYAIGGVNIERMEEITKAKAVGGCMMSGMMKY